jgi:hypothetical protein
VNALVHRVVDRFYPLDPSLPDAIARRSEFVREISVMILYLSVVLLATLTAVPSGSDVQTGDDDGGWLSPVVAIVWGTTVGLALAHWFAFRLATSALGGGSPSGHDVSLGFAQVLGAIAVAAVTTLAIVLAPPGVEVQAAGFVPACFIGAAGFGVARAGGRSRPASLVMASVVLAVGLIVAGTKAWLGH